MSFEVVWAAAITAVVTGIVGYIFGYIKDTSVRHRVEKEKQYTHEIERDEAIKTIMLRQEELSEQFKELSKQVVSLEATVQHVTNGGKVLLRDRIIQSCRVFIEKGSITLAARTNISDMYHWYHDELHGNGLGEVYYNKMLELKIVDDGIPTTSHLELEEKI
jgi:hypothetical protein